MQAAKEAVIKAISSFALEAPSMWKGATAPLTDIEVLPSASHAPSVQLHGHAQRVASVLGVKAVKVSISHTDDHALAQAVAF